MSRVIGPRKACGRRLDDPDGPASVRPSISRAEVEGARAEEFRQTASKGRRLGHLRRDHEGVHSNLVLAWSGWLVRHGLKLTMPTVV